MAAQNRADNAAKAKGKPRGRPFQPGNCANPGGKPKKLEELAAKCREFDDELIERLMQIVRKGKDKDSTPAAKLLLAYGHGSPRQVVTDADGNNVAPLGVLILPCEKL